MKSNLLTILTLTFPVLGQTTVKDALVQHWKTSAEFRRRRKPSRAMIGPRRGN